MHLKWLRATENANPLLLEVLKHRDGMKTASKTASGKTRLREGLLVPVVNSGAKR